MNGPETRPNLETLPIGHSVSTEQVAYGPAQVLHGPPVARVAMYHFKPGTVDAVLARAERELLPILQRQPGYVSYEGHKLGEDRGLSLSAWDTRPHAEAANDVIEAWVRENIAEAILSADCYLSNAAFFHRR